MFQKAFLKTTWASRFRSGIIALCAIGAIVLAAVGPLPLLANPGTVTVRVNPVTRAAPVNGTFTVDIVADVGAEMNPNGLGAYEFDLTFDPAFLQVEGIANGDFLGSTERNVFAEDTFCGEDPDNPGEIICADNPNSYIDNEVGRAGFAAFSLGTDPGPSEEGVLATVTLRAKRAGVTTLNLENALLTDTQANAWPDAGAGNYLNIGDGIVTVVTVGAADFDGDGQDDIGLFRPSWGAWFILTSSSNYMDYIAKGWGAAEDIPVAGDFDGDGKADMGIFRPSWGIWFILTSSSNYTDYIAKAWGTSEDIPLVGDFDGDGKADMAIFRPSWGAWFILTSSSNYTNYIAKAWGTNGDTPLVGDFDGDGKADMAIFRPSWGAWFVLLSEFDYTTFIAKGWGTNGDVPSVGDFDGDGKADMAIFRPSWGTWFILTSSSNYTDFIAKAWGASEDIPLAGNFDGNVKADMAIFRPSWGAWFILTSSSDYTDYIAKAWGTSGDIPPVSQ